MIERAFALDAARHLSIAGRYPEILARPDRWMSWALGAIPAGLRMIRRYRPDVLWSTYPIATTHFIAHWLHRLSGIPLVADFRDPMAQVGYPENPRTWRSFDRIERAVARSAARMVFVTPSACALYRSRYPSSPSERFALVENGYDEESFVAAEYQLDRQPLNDGRLTLLHSGIVYPAERDPRALFEALGRLRCAGKIDPRAVRIRFRAPVHAELLQQLAAESETSALIEILPPVSYREALQEMLRADGLLVMQGSNCNEQIPAKLYEYLRAQRPILGLADPLGDTARSMRAAGVEHIAMLENADQVQPALAGFIEGLQLGNAVVPTLTDMSRFARTKILANLLEEVCVDRAVAPR